MKRCFVMFGFFVLMLLAAIITDNANTTLTNEKIVKSELTTDNQLTNEVVSENVLKD